MNALPVLLVLAALIVTGCSSAGEHRRISAVEFLELAATPTATLQHVELIGATRSRAYLSVWSMGISSGESADVYSVALDELPRQIAEELRAGRNPWAR